MKFKNIRWLILMTLLGMLIATQWRTMSLGVKYVGLGELSNFQREVDIEKAEVEQLKELIAENNDKISEYNKAIESERSIYEVLDKEIKDLKMNSGLTKVKGPGILLLIDDSERELNEYTDRSDLIVHDLDLAHLVMELQAAGAEAISVNGQRVLMNRSNIFCNGPVIKINNQHLGPPYKIWAIGNSKHLESAVNTPWSYANRLRLFGLFVEVNTKIIVEIEPYNQPIVQNYLEEIKEGE